MSPWVGGWVGGAVKGLGVEGYFGKYKNLLRFDEQIFLKIKVTLSISKISRKYNKENFRSHFQNI